MSEDSKQTVVAAQQEQQVQQQQQQLDPEMKSIQEFIGRNAGTMVKLSVFSASLFAFPIVTFFCTLHSLFDGECHDIVFYITSETKYIYYTR